jgi:hypothetical protein
MVEAAAVRIVIHFDDAIARVPAKLALNALLIAPGIGLVL